jgi:hypothetical protein
MSVLGTGIAGSVAQTSLQASQVARQRDKRARESSRQDQHVREVFESHIKGLEESDADETSARLHVDSQLRDHEAPVEDATVAPPQDTREELTRRAQQVASQTRTALNDAVGPSPPAAAARPAVPRTADADAPPLYQHLDVEA